jgi:hypothetical protein
MRQPLSNPRRYAMLQGLISLGVLLLGLSMVLEEIDSGRTVRFFLGIAVMACACAGLLFSLWVVLRKSP